MCTTAIPQFLLAAPSSGSGKTTVSRGLMALLRQRGLNVQPFKCGPDYIDTKFHTAVCGRPSINLDTFMASENHVRMLYARHAADADACVVEGMMGMFDGYDRDKGSSASIARLLHLPVVLVVDSRSAAYSLAPLLEGFIRFRPEVQVAGVIFNRVGSQRHREMLCEVCTDVEVPCLGCLPRDAMLEQSSRYLGLDFSRSSGTDAIAYLIDLLEQSLDIPALLAAVTRPLPPPSGRMGKEITGLHSAVACNAESFSFLYAAHVERLRDIGSVTFFDPEEDAPIPLDTDFLYLPGGYPEKHLPALSAARKAMDSIRAYAEAGGRTLAECGGMIYLSQGVLEDDNAKTYPLTGIFPFYITNRKDSRRLSLGYRQWTYNGQQLRGHEFHYTQVHYPAGIEPLETVAEVRDPKGRLVPTPIFRYKNVLASYAHLYWGEIGIRRLF